MPLCQFGNKHFFDLKDGYLHLIRKRKDYEYNVFYCDEHAMTLAFYWMFQDKKYKDLTEKQKELFNEGLQYKDLKEMFSEYIC